MLEKARMIRIMRKYQEKEKASKSKKPQNTNQNQDTIGQDPYRYEVFKKVCAGTGLFIFYPSVFVSLLIVIPVMAVLKWKWIIWAVILIAVPLVLQVMVNLLRFFMYFNKWDKKLPYRLKGWPELITSKKIYCDLCWTDITVTVLPNPVQETKWIEAAMALLAKRANKAFYQAEIGASDKRKKWEFNKLSASGSANPDVLKALKKTCQKELAYINRQRSVFSEVQITINSEEYQVPIEIRTSEGTAS